RKLLFPWAAGIVAQTEIARKYLQSYNKNVRVIPNSVKNLVKYPKLVDKNVILNIGRIEPGKNIIGLIEIFQKTDNEGWELWIVGDGTQRRELEILVKDLKIDDKVKFKGEIKNIDQIMGQADIFAFTSLSEGFPNSLLEAKCY